MGKPESIGNQLTSINFIGEELQTFSGRFVKLGVLTKTDLEGIIEDVNERAKKLVQITRDLKEKYLVR